MKNCFPVARRGARALDAGEPPAHTFACTAKFRYRQPDRPG